MNPNPDPFKHIRFIKTILQAFAFVTACCTGVWIALTKSNFQWNNRAVAIVALILLGFAAILMINSLSKKDRPKTLVWIVVFLGSCITIIVLAVQDLIQQKAVESQTVSKLPQQTPLSDELKQQLASNTTAVITNVAKSELQNTGIVLAVTISANFDTNDDKQSLSNATVNDRLANRVWIIPDISSRDTEGKGWESILGAPPEIQADGKPWTIRFSHLAQPSEIHEYYVSGPWQVGGDGLFTTNYIDINLIASNMTVWMGTAYSIHSSKTYPYLLYRPSLGGPYTTAGGGQKPYEQPQWDYTRPHTIMDFIKFYQDTNSPFFYPN